MTKNKIKLNTKDNFIVIVDNICIEDINKKDNYNTKSININYNLRRIDAKK